MEFPTFPLDMNSSASVRGKPDKSNSDKLLIKNSKMKGFGDEFENKKQNSKTKIDKNTEKLIKQAFLSHSKGNIKDAFKYYKYCIEA